MKRVAETGDWEAARAVLMSGQSDDAEILQALRVAEERGHYEFLYRVLGLDLEQLARCIGAKKPKHTKIWYKNPYYSMENSKRVALKELARYHRNKCDHKLFASDKMLQPGELVRPAALCAFLQEHPSSNRIAIYGAPGMGKTCAVKWLAHDFYTKDTLGLRERYEAVVYLDMVKAADPDAKFSLQADSLSEYLFQTLGDEENATIADGMREMWDATLFILDGVHMAKYKDNMVFNPQLESITKNRDRRPKHALVTSRMPIYAKDTAEFELPPFDDAQGEQYDALFDDTWDQLAPDPTTCPWVRIPLLRECWYTNMDIYVTPFMLLDFMSEYSRDSDVVDVEMRKRLDPKHMDKLAELAQTGKGMFTIKDFDGHMVLVRKSCFFRHDFDASTTRKPKYRWIHPSVPRLLLSTKKRGAF